MGGGSGTVGNTGSKGRGQSRQAQQVDIPDFLQPLVNTSATGATSSLRNLGDIVQQDNFADLTPDQQQALNMLRANSGGEFFGTAQDVMMNTALGEGNPLLDPALLERLSGAGFDFGDAISEARGAVDFTETPGARETLDATSRGDFLFGGEGFNAAVDAAVRQAQPHIMSAFGGDAASVNSGLSQHAIGQSAIDAFASQFGQERNRQLGAAEALEAGGRADRDRFLGFGENAANRARRGDEVLAGLGESERGRQLGAAGRLPGMGLLDAENLLRVGEIEQGQEQGEIDRRMQDTLTHISASLGGLPISDFLGGENRGDFKSKEQGMFTSASGGGGFGGGGGGSK